jgi:hypothetical protein
MATVQTIDSRYLNVALNDFRFGLMASSALDRLLDLNESIEHVRAHGFMI